MRTAIVAIVLAPAARADDATSLHGGEKPALLREASEAMLHLDLVALPSRAGLGATEDTHQQTIDLGTHSWVGLQGTRWSNDLDVPERGWTTDVRVVHDFGRFTVSVGASLHHLDTRYGSGTYRDLGVTIGTSQRLSRWMTGWIALTLGQRTWFGKPPDGEDNSMQLMISIGTTFK